MHSKFDYLRQRPFFVLEIYHRPRSGVRTERKDWMSEATIQSVEQPRLVTRISHSVMLHATVIIDIRSDAVIKNGLRDGIASDAAILTRCKREYSAMFASARGHW